MNYKKLKSVQKDVLSKSKHLDDRVIKTMKKISDVVGATLGPGGRPVLIEREEFDLPPFVTKDGVTVFRALGFDDSFEHAIMEVARDAAGKTADEAGDGTTTATVLAEAIVRLTHEYCARNPKISPQKVVRTLIEAFNASVEPLVKENAVKAVLTEEQGRKLLLNVAKVSANGDEQLANAVLECFDLVGDQGNVTIVEESGPFGYKVEKIQGYPIQLGYEECCGKFFPKFINRVDTQKCVMEDCVFLLYHGAINDFQSLIPILHKAGESWSMSAQGAKNIFNKHNIVVVATGFSEQVIASLSVNFANPDTLNVYPLLVNRTPQLNGQLMSLEDLAAITGANILDPLNYPLDEAELTDLGPGGLTFEASRWRSVVLGFVDEDLLIERADKLETLLSTAESVVDKLEFEERLARVSGGIAKLKVQGVSNGELKERRDRAEDAVCAVKGAIKHGCLPGGGWMLLKLSAMFKKSMHPVLKEVMAPALYEPVLRLLTNSGYNEDEIDYILGKIKKTQEEGLVFTYDLLNGRHVDPWEEGILDSVPAVVEAIKNSLSIASLLGTLGGLVVYTRDHEYERQEARSNQDYIDSVRGK